jgi:hypothetical protein
MLREIQATILSHTTDTHAAIDLGRGIDDRENRCTCLPSDASRLMKVNSRRLMCPFQRITSYHTAGRAASCIAPGGTSSIVRVARGPLASSDDARSAKYAGPATDKLR